ncbi:hypothetical protein EWM64_g6563 [Hericium alpestre]|uniref:Uncharacterized protein n=1 Tax=Hericium alpestre TaxID=135208 RepID=A0A4Y9ZUD6_9AGAM|nr:hypothetical protein EWM64_g6563 [Hericium alpestre]
MDDASHAEVNPGGNGTHNAYASAQGGPSSQPDPQSHDSGSIALGGVLQREPTLPPPDVTIMPAGRMQILQPEMSMILEATHGVRDDFAHGSPQAGPHDAGGSRQPPVTEEQTARMGGGLGSHGPVDEDTDAGSDEDEKMEVLDALEMNENPNTQPSSGLYANQGAILGAQPPITSGIGGSTDGAPPPTVSQHTQRVPVLPSPANGASSAEFNCLPGPSGPSSSSQQGPPPSAESGSQNLGAQPPITSGLTRSDHGALPSSTFNGVPPPRGYQDFASSAKSNPPPGPSSLNSASQSGAPPSAPSGLQRAPHSFPHSGQSASGSSVPLGPHGPHGDPAGGYGAGHPGRERVRFVADYTRNLMQHENNKSPFTGIVVNRLQVAEFGQSKKPCCGLADFRVDIEGYPKSAWNKSAARVFAQGFLNQYPRIKKSPQKIEEAFLTHLAGLRKEYKLRQSEEEVAIRAAKARKDRRDERRRRLFNRRVETVETFPQLRQHLDMLKRLGRNGMSSDDTDDELGTTYVQYWVLVMPWRSKDVTIWLRIIDAMSRKLQARKPMQGNQPRWRFSSNRPGHRQSQKTVVACLPKNAYDPTWFDNMDPFDMDTLDVQEEYNFRHHPDIYLAAGQPHVGPAAHKRYV